MGFQTCYVISFFRVNQEPEMTNEERVQALAKQYSLLSTSGEPAVWESEDLKLATYV